MSLLASRTVVSAACLLGVACGKKEGTDFPKLVSWEGTARIEVQSSGKPGTVTVAKRGDTYRFEAPQHTGAFGSYGGAEGPRCFLFDQKARTLTLVVDASRQALDYDVTVLDGMASKESAAPFELKESGRQGTVAGFPCDVLVGEGGGTSVEACVVKQQARSFALGAGFLPADAGWAKELLDGEHVPLSVLVKQGDAITWKAQLVALDRKPPEGAFEVPKDYDRANFIDALKRVRAQQGR